MSVQDMLDGGLQFPAEDAAVAGLQFLPHINNGHLGQPQISGLTFAGFDGQVKTQLLSMMSDGFTVR